MPDDQTNIVSLASRRPVAGLRPVEGFRHIGDIARDVIDQIAARKALADELRVERRNLKVLNSIVALSSQIETQLYRRGAVGANFLALRPLLFAFQEAARARRNDAMKTVRMLRAERFAPAPREPDPNTAA